MIGRLLRQQSVQRGLLRSVERLVRRVRLGVKIRMVLVLAVVQRSMSRVGGSMGRIVFRRLLIVERVMRRVGRCVKIGVR